MTLTEQEFNQLSNKVLNVFSNLVVQRATARTWAFRPNGDLKQRAKLAWLYVFALNTWDNSDSAYNYITESQMLKMIESIHTIS